MQATMIVRRFPIQAFVIALVTAAVLILGAAGGYWLRSLAAPAAATTVARAAAPSAAPVLLDREAVAPSVAASGQNPQGLRGSSQGLFGSGGAPDESNADLSTHRSGIQY
jgi:hypothetical protein